MNPFLCPLCRDPLQPGEKTWTCPRGHSFDVAREGYVNLLPVQHKASRDPGDNPDMVRARRAFLEAGHYQRLRDALAGWMAPAATGCLLDAGCGEGYYTRALRGQGEPVVGIDIAKTAIRLAARAEPGIRWIVATNARLPLADASMRGALCLFTRLEPAEFARVLRPGGLLLVATPSADHLQSLRERLFTVVRPHEPAKLREQLAAAFPEIETREMRFPLALKREDVKNLLAMTPYAWSAPRDRRAALEEGEGLDATAAFTVFACRRPACKLMGSNPFPG